MWVIKLGGSLLGSPELKGWLDVLARHGDGKIVIVPGGSIFADAVREAQRRSGIDDATAHRLAVMAMDQYGALLAGLNPALVTASSELEMAERGWQHRAMVWLPSQMVLADERLPANWKVTSDSLAAWLAGRVGASHLVLVKSADLARLAGNQEARHLAEMGIVDEAFEDFVSCQNFSSWIMRKEDFTGFSMGISDAVLHEMALPVRCQ